LRRIKDTDRRLDRLVHDRYALTVAEIAIVECAQ
jgi:hypothetical protein